MRRKRWTRWGVMGGVAASSVLLGALAATSTLDAIDPRYRFGSPWRVTERIDYSMFDAKPTQPSVAAYSPILPWEYWASPTRPIERDPPFVDDPALLAQEPTVRVPRYREPRYEQDAPWYREEATREPEPAVVTQAAPTAITVATLVPVPASEPAQDAAPPTPVASEPEVMSVPSPQP